MGVVPPQQDAFSKTVPIWAAVLNRALAQLRDAAAGVGVTDWDTAPHLPAWVPDSEGHQIGLRLDGWVADLLRICPDLQGLVGALRKPLRCMWVAPNSRAWDTVAEARLEDLAFTPLILVSASLPSGRQRRCLELGPCANSSEGAPAGHGKEPQTPSFAPLCQNSASARLLPNSLPWRPRPGV